ncbi:MAG: agmatine deiminase family protein [Bacteroidota bacterium]
MKCYLPLFLCLISVIAAQSQVVPPELPRYLTEQEKWDMQFLAPPPPPSGIIGTPPTVPVRAMAEWEELQALTITWQGQNAILAEIVRAARKECKVIICCNSQSTVTSAKNYLTSAGVDFSTNVEFNVIPNNSIWVRDYGPNCVYANDVDSLYFVDWIYNRTSRPLDNTVPEKLGAIMNIPVYGTSVDPYEMVNTGGNFMSDGMHTAFASRLIINENLPTNPYGASGQSEMEINTIMQQFMGIDRFIKMETLPYDVIHHIDMHIKLIDEETLLVGKYPDNVADGPQIEANIQYVLNNYKTAFGTPYKVIRIPMPPQGGVYPDNNGDYRTYANAVFVNKSVILPFYETEFDTTAARIWQEALPGYKIVGINCNSIIPSLGAIHCITKEIGVPDPIRILHHPLDCADNTYQTSYPVYATLQHRSGISGGTVWYTTDLTQPWQAVDMQKVIGDTANVWTANIPQQAAGSQVYYYIETTANSGKTFKRPMPAPEGWWKFCVFQSTATQEPAQKADLLDIYPNPAASITCIPVNTTAATYGSIALFNALGQQIETVFTGQFPSGKSSYFMDAGRYQAGAYFIQLQTGSSTAIKTLIIK